MFAKQIKNMEAELKYNRPELVKEIKAIGKRLNTNQKVLISIQEGLGTPTIVRYFKGNVKHCAVAVALIDKAKKILGDDN